tara:strand:- start:1055 stop:1216 length:162 start_codon:yes stop_codon:yes gene_type:complete
MQKKKSFNQGAAAYQKKAEYARNTNKLTTITKPAAGWLLCLSLEGFGKMTCCQ